MSEWLQPNRFRERLTHRLPGLSAQLTMAPLGREVDVPTSNYHDACVLIALHRRNGEEGFPLILRVEDEFAHSGQVGLPGGRLHPGEQLQQCALRESEEEIGLPVSQVTVLGALTPLPVPVSRHLIHPFVGITDDDIRLVPDPREVQDILFMPLDHLLDDRNRQVCDVDARGTELRNVPCFLLEHHRIWGATAMLLAEFREVLLTL